MRRAERPIMQLPAPLLWGFAVILFCQLLFHNASQQRHEAGYQPLASPLQASTYRGISMGSDQLMGYLLAIRLQLHDNQMGQHFSYSRIDYHRLVDWLQQISDINPRSEYPMLLATRVYSLTRDNERLRLILGFIERTFDHDPQLHWRRLAEASLLARHQLGDLKLALRMAEKLALQPVSVSMPDWARDIRFLLLSEMNEFESAIAIIQALLQSGAVSDPDEKRFLEGKLLDFQQKLFEPRQSGKN